MGQVHDKIAALEAQLAELEGLRVHLTTPVRGFQVQSYMEHPATVKIKGHHLVFSNATEETYQKLCNRSSTAGEIARDIRKAFKMDYDQLERLEEIINSPLSNREQQIATLYLGLVEDISVTYKNDRISKVLINGLEIRVCRQQQINQNDKLAKSIHNE